MNEDVVYKHIITNVIGRVGNYSILRQYNTSVFFSLI